MRHDSLHRSYRLSTPNTSRSMLICRKTQKQAYHCHPDGLCSVSCLEVINKEKPVETPSVGPEEDINMNDTH